MTIPAVTILEAMEHPALWASWFRTPATWAPWRAFLAALFGLPMGEEDLVVYRRCTEREAPPPNGTTEAWLVVGRRGGKSLILALIAVYLAVFRDQRAYLSPGEVGTIKVLATDRRQARVIHRYCRALLAEVPALAALIERDGDDEIMLTNGICIEIQTASFRSVRGYTVIAALCDEISFWRSDETSANPDSEIIAAIRPAMATIPNAMLLAASSPYARRGELWKAFRTQYGRDDAPALVWRADTRTMNPTVPQRIIDDAIERDPDSASAEYGAEFRSDLADYVDRAVAEAAVAPGRFELPPQPGISYVAAIDVSGGSSDSMALAIAYADGDGRSVLAALRERRPPFSPEAVAAEYAELCRAYGVTRIVGDRYGGQWPVEAMSRYGVAYEAADRTKSDFYKDLLPLLNSGKVELLDNARLVAQICALERRIARGGRDSVDHPPGAHDDVANAAAIALVLASIAAAPALWRHSDLLTGDAALAWPRRCAMIFATAGIDAQQICIAFWATGLYPQHGQPAPPGVLLIDFFASPLTPQLFSFVAARIAELASMPCPHPQGHTVPAGAPGALLTTSALVPHAMRASLHAKAVGDAILAAGTRDALVLAAVGAIATGQVKVSTLAEATSRHLPSPLSAIQVGVAPTAGGDAGLLGIASTLPPEMCPENWEI